MKQNSYTDFASSSGGGIELTGELACSGDASSHEKINCFFGRFMNKMLSDVELTSSDEDFAFAGKVLTSSDEKFATSDEALTSTYYGSRFFRWGALFV
jgi:hypothetical protein